MLTTELIRADQMVKGDRLGHLTSETISSVTNHAEVTVLTFSTPHGDAYSEVPRDQLIRIVAR